MGRRSPIDNITIDLHIHMPSGMDELTKVVGRLSQEVHAMALDLAQLTNEVNETEGTVQSAIVLIQALASELLDAAGDQERVNELATKLNDVVEPLAAAVAANSAPADGGDGGES